VAGAEIEVGYRVLAMDPKEARAFVKKTQQLSREAKLKERELSKKDELDWTEEDLQIADDIEEMGINITDEAFLKLVAEWDLSYIERDEKNQPVLDKHGSPVKKPLPVNEWALREKVHPMIKNAIWEAINQDRFPNEKSGPVSDDSSSTARNGEIVSTGTRS
jgi:transposase